MIEHNSDIPPQQARSLIQGCFADLRDQTNAAGPIIPASDRPEMELLEQEILAGEAINKLQRQLDQFEFDGATEAAAMDLLIARGVSLIIRRKGFAPCFSLA